ncbi:MAG TPA: endolytic transglycosylase MltG [Prolixibacteraceae bacterium]|nr:endolytic transglycosylase MltG [Prolixibacteraceae bacterium]
MRKMGVVLKRISRDAIVVFRNLKIRLNLIYLFIFKALQNYIVKAKTFSISFFSLIQKMGIRKKLIILFTVILLLSIVGFNRLRHLYFGPNVVSSYMLYIRTGDNFEQVVSRLKENGCLTKVNTFKQLARLKDYDTHVRPGAYRLQPGWSNNHLVNILRSGAQTPVMVTFNNIRTCEELAGKLARQLQCDSVTFIRHFKNDSNGLKLGFKPEMLPSLFIPNTYSLYWTTTPAGFLFRMKYEYDKFWNDARKLKAKLAGLTADQVATLASIVQEESNKNDEKPVIAGVYLNRLRNNWPLQADPTIRFALADYTIRRILTAHLAVDSPYNTYLNTGLPPGPINFPEISSLEAVLNYRVHDYFYFCAKEDFSGYHNFAKSLSEHNRNAQKYQAALNKMKVYK